MPVKNVLKTITQLYDEKYNQSKDNIIIRDQEVLIIMLFF